MRIDYEILAAWLISVVFSLVCYAGMFVAVVALWKAWS